MDRIEASISSGLFTKWFNDVREVKKMFNIVGNYSEECAQNHSSDYEFTPIKLANLKYFGYFLLCMIVLAIITLISEYLLGKSKSI